eukprot:8203586-Pyramimonas_sp.AAC.1
MPEAFLTACARGGQCALGSARNPWTSQVEAIALDLHVPPRGGVVTRLSLLAPCRPLARLCRRSCLLA